MRNWLVSHLHVLLFSLRRLLTTPLSSLLNILVIGIALSLPAGMYLMLKSVQSLTEQTTDTHQISLFLNMDADTNEVTRIGNQLKQHTGINRIKFVPRDQALEQLKQTTGLTDVIGGMAQNPLPDAYIIYPKKTDAQALETLRDELQKWPKVEHVQLDSAWAHKLEAILKFGLLAAILLAVLLSFALIAITFNTIRLQILTRREEIEVSRLIGATNAFIRRPFLYYGLLQGLLGGIAALLIITLSLSLLNNNLAELTHLYASNFKLHLPSAGDSATLLLLSAYLGWLGAWLSVSRHLWETESH
jgi:cell division transport system permease protein